MTLLRLACLLLLTLAAAPPAQARWLKAESASFVVYGEMDEAELRKEVALLEDYDQLLRSLTGTREKAQVKVPIYLVRGGGEMRRVLQVGSGVAGFYSVRPSGIVAVADRNSGMADNDVLLHEYAHHFMYQYYPAAYPSWFVEGFAEYMMTAEFKPDVIEYGRNNADRTDWLEEGFWLPMDKLLHTDPSKIRGAKEISLFYTQSWLTVHYILRDPARRAALYKYLTAIGEGKDRRAAFADAFGMTTLDFQKALRTYMRSGTTYTRRKRASLSQPVAMTVTALPASADDLLLYQAGLRLNPTAKGCRSFEGPVRRAAARHAEDPFALRVRAHAELLCGDRAEAAKILDKLVGAAPNDAELLYLRGMADLRAGDAEPVAKAAHYAKAALWFGRAHKADAAYYPALYRYAQSRSTAKDFLSDNNVNVLLLARSIAPQVDEISVDAGRLLMLRERFDDARLVLAPVAAKTHGGKIAEVARALLAAAEKKEKTGPAMTPFVFPEED